MIEPEPSQTGHVYLVGAGPGDPGLLTLRGMECLARAELVLYDYLVNPAVLAHARESAELVCLGHHRQCRRMDQGEVNRRMIQAAAEGRIVVRLKAIRVSSVTPARDSGLARRESPRDLPA